MNIKQFILKHINKLNDKMVYIQTDNVNMVNQLYQDLIDSGYKTNQLHNMVYNTFLLYSFTGNDYSIEQINIKNEIYFKSVPVTSSSINKHKLFHLESEDIVIINYDFIIRYNKINNLKKLCLVQFPKIEKFTKENIYFCHVPHDPSKFFYDEVYSKGILRKEDLEIGKYYFGKCRNARVARWDGEYFTYMRTKFNSKFPEEINHLQDDDGYDLFMPIEKVIPTDDEKII